MPTSRHRCRCSLGIMAIRRAASSCRASARRKPARGRRSSITMGALKGVRATMPPAPTPSSTCASPMRTSTTRSRGPTLSWSRISLSTEPRGASSLKRFKTHPIARISATMAIRLKLSCARLPTDRRRGGLRHRRHLTCSILSVCAHHVGEPDAEFFVDHHHLAARDAHAVHQHVERLARQAVEFHDGARRQLQQLAHRHACARPTSSARVTATSRISFRFISWPPAPAALGPRSLNCARATAADLGSGGLIRGLLEEF